MKIELRRLQISGGVLEWSHGMTHSQDYIILSDGDGTQLAVTPYQGGWLIVDSEHALKGELVDVLMDEI